MRLIITVLFLSMLATLGLAQEAVAPIAELSFLDKALAWVEGIDGSILMGAAMVIEFGMRFIKTEKPKSIMYMVGDGVKALGKIFTKSGEILDKVLPQKVKE